MVALLRRLKAGPLSDPTPRPVFYVTAATRVWYTPVALAARGAALGAHVSLVQMCNDTLERLKLTPRPAEGDARPVRYVGFLDAPGMPTHFVRLELAPDADPAFVAASLP